MFCPLLFSVSQVFEDFPDVEESAGDVEATFPLATLQGQEDFALTVEVAVPLRIFGVAEVVPSVLVDAGRQ